MFKIYVYCAQLLFLLHSLSIYSEELCNNKYVDPGISNYSCDKMCILIFSPDTEST